MKGNDGKPSLLTETATYSPTFTCTKGYASEVKDLD